MERLIHSPRINTVTKKEMMSTFGFGMKLMPVVQGVYDKFIELQVIERATNGR